jgi:class 3 adenylate cyclase
MTFDRRRVNVSPRGSIDGDRPMPGNQQDSAYRGALTDLIKYLTGLARGLREYNSAVDEDPVSATPPPHKPHQSSGIAEVDAVSTSFSVAVDVLSRHIERLRCLVGPGAALVSKGGPIAQTATVLHCALEERKSRVFRGDNAADTIETLRKYGALMSRIIEAHEGVLLPLSGSGLLAVFGLDGEPAHPNVACECAMEILSAMDQFNAHRSQRRDTPVKCGVGIGTGNVLLSRVPLGRADAVVAIGEPVHVAARLQTMSLDEIRPLLLSDSTARALDGNMPTDRRESLAVLSDDEISGVYTVNRPPPHVDFRETLDELFGPDEALPRESSAS